MRFISENLTLSDSVLILLRDLIEERLGVYYDNNNRDLLADKLSPCAIAAGFDSFLDYYYLLKYDENSKEEWKRVMEALSVPETFFWREIAQINFLVNVLVPQYFDSHLTAPFKIWSAACSSGEEPLTIAMALNEAGWLKKIPIEIYASDANPAAIAKAKKGIYQERSFRNLSPSLKAKYFERQGEGWQILPEIHAKINWKTANLMVESDLKPFANTSVIFCRNVFIYFSEKSIQKTVDHLFDSLRNPGYLCLAACESLWKLKTKFELQDISGAFIYVKR